MVSGKSFYKRYLVESQLYEHSTIDVPNFALWQHYQLYVFQLSIFFFVCVVVFGYTLLTRVQCNDLAYI
ncbi:unnamed protein product [Trifolium pratense]|uniref:Uncharacterized protein n=1 Tax=Trifolium pratense TaxID=57577 RepID=A0ACB0J9X9_TRIPR|nr:unnamed protein product [Trifolium pratense]